MAQKIATKINMSSQENYLTHLVELLRGGGASLSVTEGVASLSVTERH